MQEEVIVIEKIFTSQDMHFGITMEEFTGSEEFSNV